jgi:hypothetical protein
MYVRMHAERLACVQVVDSFHSVLLYGDIMQREIDLFLKCIHNE